MPMAMINQDANSAYQLDQILQRIQLSERKLSTQEDGNHIDLLISIANELGTDVLDARCYHRLFDKILHILQHYESTLKSHAVIVNSIYHLCSRVLCQSVIKNSLEEIAGIHDPTKAVFFNLIAYQSTQVREYLLDALVFSTRDDYNLEYLVQTVKPFLSHLSASIILDCLVERSNYRAQEYYFEALLDAKISDRSIFIEALARFKPGCDISRLLQALLSKSGIEGCWKHILLISDSIEECMLEQLVISLLQSDSLMLDDLRSITEFVIQSSIDDFSAIIKKLLIIKTSHPNDNPAVFELLSRLDLIEKDVISIQLVEMYLRLDVELYDLIPFVRQVSNNRQVAKAIWKHFSTQQIDILNTLPFTNTVLVGLIDSETDQEVILTLYPRMDSVSDLRVLSDYYCDYEMLVNLLSLLSESNVNEELLEHLIELMNTWITDPNDKEALSRKLTWLSQGLLVKSERSRILNLLNNPQHSVPITELAEQTNNTDLDHHLLAFTTFHEE